MKIVDCFIFYNEIDMLLYRLETLNEYVDYFILVESKYTHSGKEKQIYYLENKHLFEIYDKKIIHILLDDFPYKFPNIDYTKNQQWDNEHYQRNAIKIGIDKLNLCDEDILLHLLTFQTPILDVVFTTPLFTYFSKELKL